MFFYMQLRNWFLIFVIAVMIVLIQHKSQRQNLNPVRALANLTFSTASR